MKNTAFFILILIASNQAISQSLEEILGQESLSSITNVTSTFNGTKIMNGHSIETRQKGVLEFLIQHRFGQINSGAYELFGLDQSNIRLGLEYAITNDFTIALGRSSFNKVYDGYLKYRLLKQKEGNKGMPVSVTLYTSVTRKTLKDYDPQNKPSFNDRLAYTSQVLIAHKFNPNISIQLTPTYIHYNRVSSSIDPNDLYALGIGTKIKIAKQLSLNGEYYYSFNKLNTIDSKNSIAIGLDIETGGHVFQLIFTNSRAMVENAFIAESAGDIFKADIHFGFNISRDFYLKNEKETEKIY